MTKSEKENDPARGARVRSLRPRFRRCPFAVPVCLVAMLVPALDSHCLASGGCLHLACAGLGGRLCDCVVLTRVRE